MTQDFKDKLLKYLTNNLSESTGNNTPQYQAVQTITNNIYTYITTNYYGSTLPYVIDIIKSNQNDNYLCYGIGSSGSAKFGFILILDSGFQIIQATNQYTSGTTMSEFIRLCQSPNGTFYGIDKNSSAGTYRFILLNNMLMKATNQTSYKFVMQKTYNITSNYPSNFKLVDILKNPNGGEYLIYGYRLVGGYDRPCAIEYTINVGIANEWTQYDYSSGSSIGYNVTGGWASWDAEGNLDFMLIGGADSTTNTVIYLYKISGSSIALNSSYNTNIDTSGIGQFDALEMKSVILSKINAYVVAYVNSSTPMVYIFRITNGGMSQLYKSSSYSGLLGQFVTFGIKTDYINTYFWYLVPSGSYYDFYAGLLIGNNVYQTLITNTDVYPLTLQCSFNQYNLYSFNLQVADTLYRIPFVFNQYNYNGVAYENVNSLAPNSGVIYDDNGDIIFARNLYNLNINGNTTISTIEVPNTFLNDVNIAEQDLISQTNGILNQNTDTITTNIYENLDINFFNTLVMKNDNTPNEIINNEGASRLNNSISQTTDYSDATANKIRINFQDGTSLVQNVSTPTITNGVATYTISIYVPKAITNIEIISNDENTSYQTITGAFTIGKYYTLTQDVRVE